MVMMTSLSKKNGDWFSRKAIPADVRKAYSKAYGVSQEERFRRPATLPHMQAVAEFRDWDAEISSRIATLRAAATESAIDLTQRQISVLCGDWYGWFVHQHEDSPGDALSWDAQADSLFAVYAKFDAVREGTDDDDEPLHPTVQRHVDAKVQELGQVPTFLAEKGVALSPATLAAFTRALEDDLIAAFALLRRRSGGDYSPDQRLSRYAASALPALKDGVKLSGLNSWQAFEDWVKERKPAASTVGRWRGVFEALNKHFEKRDVAMITHDEAITWKGSLIEGRTARVVNEVWLRSVITVFNWLVANRKIKENPFEGVKVAAAKKVKKREREFLPAEWKAILTASLVPPSARVKTQKAASRRWVPWLCAYTGSRPGEMTQLQGASVYEQDGIWIIDISPEDGTVKGASFRKVPIHEHLIAQGFLDFVKRSGPGPLFYDPDDQRAASDDPTKPVRPAYVITRQKLAEWVRKDVGVTDPNISPNHAWRHTFKRRAARAEIDRRFRFAFCGHEDGDVGDQYETPTLEDMAEAIKKFPRYELEWTPVTEA